MVFVGVVFSKVLTNPIAMRDIAEIYDQKVERLRVFFGSCRCVRAVIALSGGIDSAVVVPLAVAALGRDNVRVVMLPSRYSSVHSVDDSLAMCERLAIKGDVISIDDIFSSALQSVEPLFDVDNCGVATENMQSRIRCMLTMALANATGSMMLNTSNRAEILVGYGTLYGDTSGAVAVIGDLYKDEVYALAHHINRVQGDVIPINIIDKAPSAELRPDQKDSDSLPDYLILDPVLRLLADEKLSVEQVIERGYDSEVVQRIDHLCRSNAFKAKQLPPLL